MNTASKILPEYIVTIASAGPGIIPLNSISLYTGLKNIRHDHGNDQI